jgi:hypothetical protein
MYNGKWQNGNRHGWGAFFVDGEVVHGEWENDSLIRIDDTDSLNESFFSLKRRRKVV